MLRYKCFLLSVCILLAHSNTKLSSTWYVKWRKEVRGELIITKTVIYYFTEIVEMGFHCRSGNNMELVCSQQAIKCIIMQRLQ